MTYQTVKIYKRLDELVPFHTSDMEMTDEAEGLIAQTENFRQVHLLDPLTLMIIMYWPDQATRDTFFANPAIIAHFENVNKTNADKGITVDFQSAQEV